MFGGATNVAKASYHSWRTGRAGRTGKKAGDVPVEVGPWGSTGYELTIMGQGGWRSLERHRNAMILRSWANYVREHRKLTISGDSHLECSLGSLFVKVKRDVDPELGLDHAREPYAGTAWGRDELVVSGDVEWKCKARTTLLSGSVERSWTGSVSRMVGMEGIICGGAFARTFAGVASTMSPLASGDVYGGCARVAGVRVYLGGLGYRSADASMWNMGLYSKSAAIIVEPAIGSPSQNAAKKSMGAKALKLLESACPLIDIGAGLVKLGIAIGTMIAARRGWKPKPPNVAPRMRTRNVGFWFKSGMWNVY